MPPKTPYPFQEEAILLGLERNLLLGDACGLGKKLTCLEIARRLRDDSPGLTLTVTVKPDVLQWEREIQSQDPSIPVVIGTSDALWVPERNDWWLILHYEAAVRHVKALARVKWRTVILDEGHYIKNHVAQRSQAVKKFKASRRIVATGTPIDRTPGDLWSPLEYLYPETYRGRMRAFKALHERGYTDSAGYYHVLPGARSPELLARELAPFTRARTKEEVASFLPPNIIKQVPIPLTGLQGRLYRRIEEMDDIELFAPELLHDPLWVGTRLAQLVRLQQAAVDPELLGSSAGSAKFDWLYEWRANNPDEPIIVFTNYRRVAQRVAKALNAHLVIGGGQLPAEWTRPTVVATIGAGSTALDLGHLRTAIFLDTHRSHLKMTQAINRIHRLSSELPAQTIYLTAVNTVDEDILQAFTEKWDSYQLLRAHIERRHAKHP